MRRRAILSTAVAALGLATAGCAGPETATGTTTVDRFPDDVANATRGDAGVAAYGLVGAAADYEDGSLECAKRAHDAVYERLEAELALTHHVSTGYGRGPEGYDGMAVNVHLQTAIYGRDGDLISEAEIDVERLVAATPATAYLRTEDGVRICAVPVYVTTGTRYVD